MSVVRAHADRAQGLTGAAGVAVWLQLVAFYELHGRHADAVQAVARAFFRNVDSGSVAQGGSTITQQLAKNLFLSGERSFLRKSQELVLTFMLETLLSKRRIYEIYLNHVEWGAGIYGAQAAARHYFGKNADQLSPFEAARLAVMLPRPRYFEKLPQSPYLAERSQIILSRMGAAVLP